MEIPFLQAKFFTSPAEPRKIELVVLHSAVVPELFDRAEWLMKLCATNDRKASWHYAVDGDSITQSVREEDIAWHAPGANQRGIGIELATAGMPTRADWEDQYSRKMLELAAFLTAGICVRRSISPFFVDAAGLIEGRRGITTHAEVSKAFKRSDHMDPGPAFPMESFLADVSARMSAGNYQGD
jgi:N-acetyl-anhydromuramyl-L-alanine amidase AmpD